MVIAVCVAVATVVLLIKVAGGHKGVALAGQAGRLTRHTVDQLSIRYPTSWVSLPLGGPPNPGPAPVEEYLTNAAVVRGCTVGRANASSARRCSPPAARLSPGQVLVELSEGFYAPLDTAATPILHGHRVQTERGRITSIEPGACPTGATNYAQTTIDEQPAAQETRSARRAPLSGYRLFICANSATHKLPATVNRVIESLSIMK